MAKKCSCRGRSGLSGVVATCTKYGKAKGGKWHCVEYGTGGGTRGKLAPSEKLRSVLPKKKITRGPRKGQRVVRPYSYSTAAYRKRRAK